MTCALVLAAGQSRRMGQPKLLLPVAGQPMITRVVDAVLRPRVDHLVVVVAPDTEPHIRAALGGRRVRLATNSQTDSDMLASIRCGLRALPDACAAILVALGDQPGITGQVVDALLQGFIETAARIAVPIHQGRRGHPIVFRADLRQELMEEFDGVGLHGLLAAHAGEVVEVAVDAPEILQDIDTPADYARLRGREGA